MKPVLSSPFRAFRPFLWAVIGWLAATSFPNELQANNIRVTNVRLTGLDTSAGPGDPSNFTLIRFDLAWENAWRLNYNIGMNNHDAAWVIIKFRVLGGTWRHAYLNDAGHQVGTWGGEGAGPARIDIGYLDPALAYDATTNPGMGAYISNSSIIPEPGPFSATNMRLRWNYGRQGVPDGALVELKVIAIETVYIPQGFFFVGTEGQENGSFTEGSWSSGNTVPLLINSENALTIGTAAGNLWGRSSSGDSSIGGAGSLPEAFPKGYRGFYLMKYEITQRQWVDFFNMLTDNQKTARDLTDLNGKNSDGLVARNNVSWSSGDATLPSNLYGEVPCSYLSWADVAAYLDWTAMRPFTELEFEKATRGERRGVRNEYAWGTDGIGKTGYTVAFAGTDSELIASNYTSADVGGNAWYAVTRSEAGPVRVGIFAADTASTGRATAGAARYGNMEMSGNVWERTVNVASTEGRAFTGVHGDGEISLEGEANVSDWPASDAAGIGLRGGGWTSDSLSLRVSDRSLAAIAAAARVQNHGGRGARTRQCSVPASAPPAIDTNALFGNVIELATSGAGVGEGYLWVLPSDWRIINGQGSNRIFVTSASFPARLWVAYANECGYGAATFIDFP